MIEGERKAVLSVERGLHTLTYRWTSNPALRTPSPPLADVTGASSGLFLVCAPGEPFGRLSGPGAGIVVMAEADGQIELTLRATIPGGSLAAEIELKRVEAPRPAFAAELPAPRRPLPEGGAEFILSAHVSLRGDLQAARGDWICGPGAPGRIEGIEVRPLAGSLPVEYQVATGGRSGGWTGWFPAGSYAGSRGKAQPLIGIRLRVRPDAAAGLALDAEAAFLGAPTLTRAGREIELTGPCLLDPLVGFRLDLVPAASLPAESAPAPEAAPTPRAPGRLRVFRRAPPPAAEAASWAHPAAQAGG